jgi:chromate transporter
MTSNRGSSAKRGVPSGSAATKDRVQSAGNQKVSRRREPANEQRKCRLFLQSLLQIGFEHRELIEIGEEGDVRFIYPWSTHAQRYNALRRSCAMAALRTEVKTQAAQSDSSLWTLALVFLRLGATAFGGPAAHIAMMEQEFVRKRGWLSREKFLDLLGAANLIPGPTSTEVGIYIGHLHAGWPGLLLAGICFIGPAAVLTLALAWAYTRLGVLPSGNAVLYGIKPVIIAIVALALWSLARTAVRSWTRGAIALAGLVAAALGTNLLLVLFGAGVLSVAIHRTARETARSSVVLVNLGLPSAIASFAPFSLTALFLAFLKIGAVLFGSGYLLLAFLRADFVDARHWLTEGQLLDAVAAGQVTPGPVFSTATFIGYLLGGMPGAAVATLGIFLPSFVFVAASGRLIPRLRKSPITGAFLDGVNVASMALMTLVSWQLGRAAIVDLPTALLALISAVMLIRFELNSVWLILAGAFAGLVLRLR